MSNQSMQRATLVAEVEASASPGPHPAMKALDASATSRWAPIIIACTLLGMLLEAADQTIVSAAAPRIMAELAGFNNFAWMTTAYLLGITVTMPIYGKLADTYDAKRIFLSGALLFIASSALCGLSQSMIQLILCRALQGVGAGALAPVGVVIMSGYVTPERRASIQGTAGGIFLFATVAGPVLGGWLTDHWSWRMVFYINVPLGLLAAGGLAMLLPASGRRRPNTRIDYAGGALLAGAVVPLLIFVGVPAHERAALGPATGWALALGEAAVLAVFAWHESRTAEPIIDPHLLALRPFVVPATATTLLSAVTFGSLVYIPLYVQGVLGGSATHGGLLLAPLMLATISARFVTMWLRDHRGHIRALALCSLLVTALGAAILFTLRPGPAANATVVVAMVVLGAGLGATNMLLFAAALTPFPRYRFGQATGTLLFLRSLGGALVIGGLGVLLSARFGAALTSAMPVRMRPLLHTRLAGLLDNPRLVLLPLDRIEEGRHPIVFALRYVMRTALASSLHDVFGTILAIAVLTGTIVVLFPFRMTRQAGERAGLVAEGGISGLGEFAPAHERAGEAPTTAMATSMWDIMCHVLYWRHGAVQFAARDGLPRAYNTYEEHVDLPTSLRDPRVAAAFARAWPAARAETALDRYRAESIVDLLYHARELDGDVAVCGDNGKLAVLLAMVVHDLHLDKDVYVYRSASRNEAVPSGDTATLHDAVLHDVQVMRFDEGEGPARTAGGRRWACICIEHDDYLSTRACLDSLLPAATPGAAVIVGHYHNARDGARRATEDVLNSQGVTVTAGPLPQIYWYAGSRDHAAVEEAPRMDWSQLGEQDSYAAFLRWIAGEIEAIYQDQGSARNRHIALSLAKRRLGQRADRYLTLFIATIFGPTNQGA